MKTKSIFRCAIWMGLMILLPAGVWADSAAPQWRGGPHAGFSPYTGIIGGELQYEHWGFTIGAPAALGVRYYLGEDGTRWFIGAHGMWYKLKEDEDKDGIHYTDQEHYYTGGGFGYKWRFKDHWDLVASLSLAYYSEQYSNPNTKRTETGILLFPGLTIGYSF
ncbi:MAG: DUF3575 domain-containing protein [Desulfobacteraceae bacterium]|nr:DUF3575 domain-containing protein [Desulfobacteraceae bacterium]